MRTRTLLLTALAATASAGPAAAAKSGPEPAGQAIAAFRSLCAVGPLAPAAVLARAKQQGWRSSGSDAPHGFDPASQRLAPVGRAALVLKVTSEASAGERRDACSIAIDAPTGGLAAAVGTWLGFPPAFAMGLSATYFAIRNGDDWQSGKVSQSEFAQAKAQGRFYSIIVLDRGTEEPEQGQRASLVLLRVKPETAD